ncbi:MAG: hypothetical protein M5U28_16585 [Sandaracinaceae bacterium]|nr:hypothetical protein [Sandaracinaceae bacterium]
MDAEVRADAASIDAAIDGGAPDAGPDDAGAPDAGSPDDAGPPDGGPSDAGPIDGAIACATDCSELTDACHDGVCDRSTGTCTAVSAPDGSSCDDGAACTSGDACAAGVCSGTAVDCSAMSDACHTGVCDPATGACTRTTAADGTPCSDASPCTTDDACTAGACAGTAVDCSAMSDACHTGICDPATGACTRTTAADGTPLQRRQPLHDGRRVHGRRVRRHRGRLLGDVRRVPHRDLRPRHGRMHAHDRRRRDALQRRNRLHDGRRVHGRRVRGSPVVCSGTVCMPSSCGPLGTCVSSPAPNGTPCTFDANLCTRDECSSGTCGGRLVCRPPSDFMPFGATTNTIVRGATSTTLTEDTCPIGSALVGVEARIGAGVTYLGTVRGVCRSLSIMGSGAGPYTFVDEGPTTALPDRGTMGTGSYIAALCPAGRIMVGFTGRSGGAIDALSVRCAPLSIVATPTEWTVSVLAPSVAGTVGGTGGVAFPATDCPVGQVATRVRVHSGDFVNGFGLGCQVPRLSYAATFASAGTTTQHGGTGARRSTTRAPPGPRSSATTAGSPRRASSR